MASNLSVGNVGYHQLMSVQTMTQSRSMVDGFQDAGPAGGLSVHRGFDICLVFRYKTRKEVRFEEKEQDDTANRKLLTLRPEKKGDAEELDTMMRWKQRREAILKSLQNCGVHVNCFYSRDRNEIIAKIGASPQKLRETAARLKYKLQLKEQYLGAYAEFRHDFQGTPAINFKDRRVVSHIYKAHSANDFPGSDAIFTTTDKIFLINHIITSKDKDCAGIPVGNYMFEGNPPLLSAYFPLHEGQVLHELKQVKLPWFFMREDHANRIREYFGDKVAYYFLFKSFYCKWLLPIGTIALAMELVDLVVGTPDNRTAIPFCVLISIWTTFLPHFWRREEAKFALNWGTLDLMDKLEPCRPEHTGEPRINPVTAQVEPYYPWNKRIWNYATSCVTIFVTGILTVLFILVLCFLRHGTDKKMSFTLLMALLVELVNLGLTQVSYKLTTWENHRTQAEHETSMLAKVMSFKYLNSYFVLYYVAFFKKHGHLLGADMNCWRDDCYLDLQGCLAIFVLFRLTVHNAIKFCAPTLKRSWRAFWHERKNMLTIFTGHTRLDLAEMSAAEKQSKMDGYATFSNFDESLIFHGYATLFAVTSPWVCFATLLGTFLEIHIDKRSLLEDTRRPFPLRAKNNMPWDAAYELYGVLAAFTNLLSLLFASDLYDSWTVTEKLTLFFFIEHLIFLARLCLSIVLPSTPHSVTMMHLKQETAVHRCLENIKLEQDTDFSVFREREGHGEPYEVFEHDLNDDEEPEPELQLRSTGQTLYAGIHEAASKAVKSRSLD